MYILSFLISASIYVCEVDIYIYIYIYIQKYCSNQASSLKQQLFFKDNIRKNVLRTFLPSLKFSFSLLRAVKTAAFLTEEEEEEEK